METNTVDRVLLDGTLTMLEFMSAVWWFV
jgi:hypothetical protein